MIRGDGGVGGGGGGVCELCMRVESPTGFKTTTRHPASRQMCSKPRDKTRDDSSSFVKPFSGWDGREGGGGGGKGRRRGIACIRNQ